MVDALALDGSGNLYAGGYFTQAGGTAINYVAIWAGNSWTALGSGMDNGVYALALDGSDDLYAGGWFALAGNKPSARIAHWHNAPPLAVDDGYSLCGDSALAVPAPGVLANDGDPDADPLSASLVAAPAHGSAEPITYAWDLGDGTLAAGPVITHSYAATGTYPVVMTATNPCGTAVASHTLTVVPTPAYSIFLPVVMRGE